MQDIKLSNKAAASFAAVILAFIASTIWLALSISSIDKHEFGFVYDRFSGEIEPLEKDGFVFRPWPKYVVHTIDERPYQIRISANMDVGERVLNAKLVKFDPAGIQEFVAWHGRGAGDDISNLREIFKCYVFAPDNGASCPFIEVMKSTSPIGEETPEPEDNE